MGRNSVFKRLICGMFAAALIIICCVPVCSAADEPGYVRTVFNKSNGLPTDEANTVLQTKDGYLWIGSYGGLLRYDGTNFRNFSTEGAISTPSIRTLFQDSSERLWIGSSDAGVFLYENNKFTAVPCTEKYGFLSIRDFAEDKNGKIYVASSSGICEIRDDTMVPIDEPKVLGETIYSLGIDAYNRVWCAMNAGNCAILEDNRCVAVLEADMFFEGGRRIVCLTSDKEHNIYLGTNDVEIAKVILSGTSLDGSNFVTRIFNAYDSVYHNRISVTDNGDILISGEQGFAFLTPNGEMVDPHSPNRTTAANCATIDYEGNVWIASSNEGLIRYTPGCFATPNTEAGLSDKDINAITASNGIYYVATDEGLLAFDESWHQIHNDISEKLSNIHVKHLMADSKGRLWCGTYSDLGLVRYDPNNDKIVCFNPQNGMDSTRVRMSYEMTDGTVAVATQDGIAMIANNKVTAFYDKEEGMETQSILCLVQAPNGTLLAGSAGSGIYAIRQDGKITKYSYEQGLKDGVVLRIVPEEDGKGAFVSAGSHLYYWLNGKFRRLDNIGIGVGSIFDLFERNGRIWLMQDSGLYSVDKKRLLSEERTHPNKYSEKNGLTGSLSVNTWNYTAPDGRLYLSTRNGISIFNFQSVSYHAPTLVINSITVDDRIYEHPKHLVLDKNSRRMTINFSALTFAGTSDLCLAYQLVGFAKKETLLPNATSGTVSYTNLYGGTYTFRLRVFDPDNPRVQKTLQIEIRKEKKLAEEPFAWIIAIILFGLAAFGISQLIVRLRIKRLNQQRRMYKNIVGQSLRAFAKTIDAKDSYTNGHSVRVALYSRELTKRMGYSENDQEVMYYIALLHDIGKIGVPDSILNKEGTLTPEERAIIQTHPVKGAEILRDFTALKGITDGARFHHERYDGKGYCAGLKGEEIPLVARIVCVADCYDAMSSDRCYRKGLPPEKILDELEKGKGTQFDPEIASVMEEMIRDGIVPVSATLDDKISDTDKENSDTVKENKTSDVNI